MIGGKDLRKNNIFSRTLRIQDSAIGDVRAGNQIYKKLENAKYQKTSSRRQIRGSERFRALPTPYGVVDAMALRGVISTEDRHPMMFPGCDDARDTMEEEHK